MRLGLYYRGLLFFHNTWARFTFNNQEKKKNSRLKKDIRLYNLFSSPLEKKKRRWSYFDDSMMMFI